MANEDVFVLRVCDEDGNVYDASHSRIQDQFDKLADALREAREKQKQLEARVAELEEDGCWLSERCATCGHRFAYPADHCPRCGVKVGPNEPDVYPELCECPRCIVARNVAMDAAMKTPGGEDPQ